MTTAISETAKTISETTQAAATDLGRRDKAARAILAVCAAGATLATVTAAIDFNEIEGSARLAETWRLFGFPVFAGIFLILAAAPRRVAGLWELIIANKLALAIAGGTYLSDVEGSQDFVFVDGVLAALLVTGYVLTRGWTAWSDR
jgi:hypothetical protein